MGMQNNQLFIAYFSKYFLESKISFFNLILEQFDRKGWVIEWLPIVTSLFLDIILKFFQIYR